MHFKGELSALVKRMLPEELLERIRAGVREELEGGGGPGVGADEGAGGAAR